MFEASFSDRSIVKVSAAYTRVARRTSTISHQTSNTRKGNQNKLASNIQFYLQQHKQGLKLVCPDHSKLESPSP